MQISVQPQLDYSLRNDELVRLAELEECGILDTEPEQVYDDLTSLAANICGAPIAHFSVISSDRQFFKAAYGFEAWRMPIEHSFSAQMIASRRPLVVEDTLENERLAHNPLVIGEPYIRFYAGVPVFSLSGQVLGTMCVLDSRPRYITPRQMNGLQALARQAAALLAARRRIRLLEQTVFSKRQASFRNYAHACGWLHS